MDRNTLTTLGQLRIGDRFHYPKRVDVWQVIHKTSTQVSVNLPGLGESFVHKYPELKRGTTPVIFMRHTKPLPGERCLFQDLKHGDVFGLPDDVIKEYVVEKDEVTALNTLDMSKVRGIHGTDPVIFLRNQY